MLVLPSHHQQRSMLCTSRLSCACRGSSAGGMRCGRRRRWRWRRQCWSTNLRAAAASPPGLAWRSKACRSKAWRGRACGSLASVAAPLYRTCNLCRAAGRGGGARSSSCCRGATALPIETATKRQRARRECRCIGASRREWRRIRLGAQHGGRWGWERSQAPPKQYSITSRGQRSALVTQPSPAPGVAGVAPSFAAAARHGCFSWPYATVLRRAQRPPPTPAAWAACRHPQRSQRHDWRRAAPAAGAARAPPPSDGPSCGEAVRQQALGARPSPCRPPSTRLLGPNPLARHRGAHNERGLQAAGPLAAHQQPVAVSRSAAAAAGACGAPSAPSPASLACCCMPACCCFAVPAAQCALQLGFAAAPCAARGLYPGRKTRPVLLQPWCLPALLVFRACRYKAHFRWAHYTSPLEDGTDLPEGPHLLLGARSGRRAAARRRLHVLVRRRPVWRSVHARMLVASALPSRHRSSQRVPHLLLLFVARLVQTPRLAHRLRRPSCRFVRCWHCCWLAAAVLLLVGCCRRAATAVTPCCSLDDALLPPHWGWCRQAVPHTSAPRLGIWRQPGQSGSSSLAAGGCVAHWFGSTARCCQRCPCHS